MVILESTVNPGVCENVVLPILEEISGLICGEDFDLAHCPERINPGDPQWNVENIPRVVGAYTEAGLARVVEFYSSILEGDIRPMGSLKEAEAVKVVENTFRDVNIAFVNELAMSFAKLGIDVVNVIDGAATKPFAFMPHYPGCGIGGHCIPVDPYYLIAYAKENGFDHEYLSLARQVNSYMPQYTVGLLKKAFAAEAISVMDARVAVLGLSYKPGIADCRESPAWQIIAELEKLTARVIAYDPFVPYESHVASLSEALDSCQAVIITTAHDEFVKLSPHDFLERNINIVIDGRNCLAKSEMLAAGLQYHGIGR